MFERLQHVMPRVGRRRDEWWRGAVIYQIYPRSFQDTNDDGVGDLPGITARLEHAARLGVDAVWVSPFFKSPMKDYGYDVADYRAVDPLFGTLDDFDRLLEKAHGLGLRLLVDFVASHTSNEHPWFLESRESRDNPRADWYVWADAKPDGSPPSNWLSVFGGPSWEWEPRRGQYYLHNFLREQPDLNFHNPAVIEALLAEAEFWLQRGVDGFRLDAIDCGVHDPQLRDNPPRPPKADKDAGLGLAESPHSMQIQLYNKARPELADLFFKPLWRLTETFDGRFLLAEIAGDRAIERISDYSAGGGVDTAYSFDLLLAPPTAAGIRGVIEEFEGHLDEGWPSWSFGNHDITRAVTRFASRHGGPTEAMRLLIPVLLCSLRGTVCLYQGEELGLDEAELELGQLRDPYGIAFWPRYKGRDGARTPMPWVGADRQGGFTGAEPWLPLPQAHLDRAVDTQQGREGSTLERLRAFLAWRRPRASLCQGGIAFLNRGADVLAFERTHGGERLICLFNLSGEVTEVAVPAGAREAYAASDARLAGERAHLPAWGFLFADLEREA